MTLDELKALLAQLLAEQQGQQPPAPPVDDFIALPNDPNLPASNEAYPHTGAHDFDIPLQDGSNRVVTPFDDDFPAYAEKFGVWPYRGLRAKRRALGLVLRRAGMATKPAWFDDLLDAQSHNAGVDNEVARLQGVIASLNALKV